MSALTDDNPVLSILLAMTAVTGVVDAVSFLNLGHIFTANMTGNVVFLGFALGGAPDISMTRSLLALGLFLTGAVLGGRMSQNPDVKRSGVRALTAESALLFFSASLALGNQEPLKLDVIVASTALAMGMRNAMVRKLGVQDLTTTVLTLTIAGLAADSFLAGGDNPRWQRRCAAIVAMLGGAAAGAFMVRYSLALPLFVCAVVSAIAAIFRFFWR
jgi:uncharacterized membrane protein YoaK (UPF0700 family)